MSTQIDLKSIDNRFEQVDKRFDAVSKQVNRLDNRIDRLDEKIDDKFDQVLTAVDGVMKELQDMRLENKVAHNRVYKVHQPMLEDHEKRIISLEA